MRKAKCYIGFCTFKAHVNELKENREQLVYNLIIRKLISLWCGSGGRRRAFALGRDTPWDMQLSPL
jgi:hypothetical protein